MWFICVSIPLCIGEILRSKKKKIVRRTFRTSATFALHLKSFNISIVLVSSIHTQNAKTQKDFRFFLQLIYFPRVLYNEQMYRVAHIYENSEFGDPFNFEMRNPKANIRIKAHQNQMFKSFFSPFFNFNSLFRN